MNPSWIRACRSCSFDASSSLALVLRQGVGERLPGVQPRQRECGFRREGGQQRQLVGAERALLVDRDNSEHAGHALLGDHRNPDTAFRADELDESRVDERRAHHIEHGDRGGIEHRAGDARRLVAQVDGEVVPPLGRFALELAVDAVRPGPSLVHHDHPGKAGAEEPRHLPDERPSHVAGALSAPQLRRDPGDRLELEACVGAPLLRSEGAAEAARVSPSTSTDDEHEPGEQRGDRGGERHPDEAADRPTVVDDERRERRGGDCDARVDQRGGPVGRVRPGPQAPQGGEERKRKEGVHRRHEGERDGVEEQRFCGVSHGFPCAILRPFPAGQEYRGHL